MFDPYHRWLSIPKQYRPPTYYQLLGIDPDETDPEVIKEAALRQTSHVRMYQTGPYAEACTKLLNEIALARATLLHPDKRREYDARLPRRSPPALSVVEVEPVPLPVVEVERVSLPPPRLDVRAGVLILLGAGCMLVVQLIVWGVLRLALSVLRSGAEE